MTFLSASLLEPTDQGQKKCYSSRDTWGFLDNKQFYSPAASMLTAEGSRFIS